MASESGSAASQPFANWTSERESLFIDICVEFIRERVRGANFFYGSVTAALNERTGLGYTETQIKNKWDNLRRSFRDWNALLQIPGGVWDPIHDQLDGTDQWWESAPVRRYRRFRRNAPVKFRAQNLMFSGCIGKEECQYPIPLVAPPTAPAPAPAPAHSFTAQDAGYYSDWIATGNPPSAQVPRHRFERGSTSRSGLSQPFVTPQLDETVDRCLLLLQGSANVRRWELLMIFRNDPRNVEIVNSLTDEEDVRDFLLAELSSLPHRAGRS